MNKILMLAAIVLMSVVAVAGQCVGITKKGERCKRQAAAGSSYCWQHGGAKTQRTVVPTRGNGCQWTSEKGEKCGQDVMSGSKFCQRHINAVIGADAKSLSPTNNALYAYATLGTGLSGSKTSGATSSNNLTNIMTGKTMPRKSGVSGGQCSATTKKGTRCSRKAQPGSTRCWQHSR